LKIIAFMARGHPVDEGEAIREILTHLGEPVDLPRVAPAEPGGKRAGNYG
jgi:hypothetical protein